MGAGEEIVIREYSDEYKEAVIQLILEIQQREFNIPIQREDQPDLGDIPNFYQQKSGNFWIAFWGSQPVGTISLLDIGNGQGALRKMFVKADYRGSRFNTGKKLLDRLITWTNEKQMSEIYLGTTVKFLAAHRFYEKNGFAEITVKDLPAAFPIMKVDTKFYKYVIAADSD